LKPVPEFRYELLEMRRLLSAGIHLQHNGLLKIMGAGAAANTITVGLSADQQEVDVSISYPAAHHSTKVITGAYPVAEVSTIFIAGGSKSDYISVDQTNGSFTIPATILGLGGNDTIYGGDEPDYILGGGGNDYLNGGAGNDTLMGQTGQDTLIGGEGDDILHGGGGNNSLDGGAGNDTLYDPQGPDTMLGGAGNNTFYVYRLKTDKDNDYNAATDKLHLVPTPSDNSSFWGDVLDYYVL
jgi:Ca2+-binding RTX toxin-like protein